MHKDRSLTLSPDARTLWVHWGRTGGGPRFLADLVDGDLAVGDSPTLSAISWNPDAEIAGRLSRIAGRCAASFPVRTYNSRLGVILGLPRLVWNSLMLRRRIRRERIDRVVCVMESVYQSLALPLLVPRDVEYIVCVHDGRAHPGEGNILQSLGRRNELRRADRIVTFSDAVTAVLSQQVSVPVTTGVHPPFDLEDAATVPRELPASGVSGTGAGVDGTSGADGVSATSGASSVGGVGVDGGASATCGVSVGQRVPVIGVFGRLQRYKGIDIALDAVRILRGRGVACELRITGSGPEERLRDTALGREAVWDNRWIPEEEVTEVVRGMDIMLIPYTEASQSGPVTLALAHAVPCVGTPVGAIPEQLEGFGVVTRDISAVAVADALEELLGDAEHYRELSLGAVRRVAEHPDWSDLAGLVRTGGTGPSGG